MLERVHERGGCVSINWHDRSAVPGQGWVEAYRLILDWARERGFRFLTLTQAAKEWSGNADLG